MANLFTVRDTSGSDEALEMAESVSCTEQEKIDWCMLLKQLQTDGGN